MRRTYMGYTCLEPRDSWYRQADIVSQSSSNPVRDGLLCGSNAVKYHLACDSQVRYQESAGVGA